MGVGLFGLWLWRCRDGVFRVRRMDAGEQDG